MGYALVLPACIACAAAAARRSISSGGTSSMWVAIHDWLPKAFSTPPGRAP
jgi:hypothetical protein